MNLQFIQSQRGARKLIFNGYSYRQYRHDAITDTTSWRCSLKSCTGKLQTIADNVSVVLSDHNHAPNPEGMAAAVTVCAIKQRAIVTAEPPRQVFGTVTRGLDLNVAALLPTPEACRKIIHRKRKAEGVNYVVPRTIADIDVPLDLRSTTRGENFLLHDSGPLDENRMLIFATSNNLRILRVSEHWFADGTFSISPQLFFQVYTIHGLMSGKILPLVYALLPNKTEESYTAMLDVLNSLENGLNPVSITTDFEKAAMNSFQTIFPNADIFGCLFHLAQSIWRNLQKSPNLVRLYNDDVDIRIQAKSLVALAFVPVDDVTEAFEELQVITMNELVPVLQYFESTYIGRIVNGARRRPLFPIEQWNVFDRVNGGLPRTNNAVEGWHRAFQQSVGCHHPTTYNLISVFRSEQDAVEQNIERLNLGDRRIIHHKPKYVRIDEQLRVVVADYRNRNRIEYLRAISHSLTF